MIERAVAAGIPFSWVTADETYGDNGPLRAFLEEEGISYVLAVARDHAVATPTGPRRADILAAAGAWHRLSCGNGAKGRRWYDWALFATTRPEISLLVRRSISRPSELAFYLCHTPQPVPLAVLVKVAGTRWCVEECFRVGKNEAGLDHYQVRLYQACQLALWPSPPGFLPGVVAFGDSQAAGYVAAWAAWQRHRFTRCGREAGPNRAWPRNRAEDYRALAGPLADPALTGVARWRVSAVPPSAAT
ncbi:hypothetical protein EAS64_08755 [Trebonia kvetii]|uniref:Transposase IS701-like DDE domain-containing protein n=1 Tax=Trebonia kvetii TaxID=2480626 RepID=A0A6P2C3E3_9ACTN|nr:hypothetical protein EAS64_08755 [Trebonia kvetii]